MNQSHHPYRQKIPQSVSTTSLTPSQYHSPQSSVSNMSPPINPESNPPYPIDEAINEPPLTINYEQYPDQSQDQDQSFTTQDSETSQGFIHQHLTADRFNAPTPPPVFTPPANFVNSPMSTSVSATSSVTNLNLPPLEAGKSDNLILSKFHHNRSVSSTSSFFDKSDTMSLDFNQNLLTQYLGDNSNHLMPRIKTIELYRKNAKKSSDPTVLFQYAQYMLQTALLLDKPSANGDANYKDGVANASREISPRITPKNTPRKHSRTQSFDLSDISDDTALDDVKLKRSILKEAAYYLKKLSDKGYSEAQYLLGDAYSSGALGKTENREAFLLFQAAAKRGHVESAYRTAYCYEEGIGTGRDARKVIEYLKMAASKNHAAAMYKLGVYSFNGRMGLPQDINTKKMGIKWLTLASAAANELIAAAPYELGKIYFEGFKDIVIQDKKYALELYSQAAALGHVQSNAILGHHYEVGDVVAQDANLSIHYYTQAAMGGDPQSMLAMCAWYLVGSDPYLPKDESESFEWAKRAAMCNLAKGQFALANFYDKGIGCIKNQQEAQVWYQRAAENGDEKALTRITNKELVAKLQKTMKKRNMGNPQPSTKNDAQDKDCVIV